MDLTTLARPEVLDLPFYEPGRPIEDVARALGLDPARIDKLASNENAWGASPLAIAAAVGAVQHPELYPDGGAVRLREAIARHRSVPTPEIVPGNGSNELLEMLAHALLRPGDRCVMGEPAFIVYRLVTRLTGAAAHEVPLRDFRHDLAALRAAVDDRTRLVFLASPNNPTGRANPAAEVEAFAASLPPTVVLVFDEAYAEYLEDAPDLRPLVRAGRPIVCLRTFSKVHGLAGLRLGYAHAPAPLARLLDRVRQPFNVNAVAQAAGIAALSDSAHVERTIARTREGRRQLEAGLAACGIRTVPSDANFLLVEVGSGRRCFEHLLAAGVIVRPMDGYGLPGYLRVTVGRPEQNERLLAALGSWWAEHHR